MKKLALLSVLAVLLPILSPAQPPPPKALNIGDTVPDLVLTNVYNYPDSVIRLSDLHAKLVILDFWATWCGSCIQTLPLLDSIQREYANDIQIILIYNEGNADHGSGRVGRFFEDWKRSHGQRIALPATMHWQDEPHLLFPHIFIPHYVWIGPDNNVISITGSDGLTRSKIIETIRKEVRTSPVKTETIHQTLQTN